MIDTNFFKLKNKFLIYDGLLGNMILPTKNKKNEFFEWAKNPDGTYEIEVAGEKFAAEAQLEPFYDPKSERIKA